MYGKVFSQMYDGTLRANWQALVTFQQLIVLADSEGVVDMTPADISHRTGIPIEHIKVGLGVLSGVDQHSLLMGTNAKSLSLSIAPSGVRMQVMFCAPARLPAHEWAPLRESVFKRDDYTCQYCGSRGGRLECDHIIPVSRGGSNSTENLATSCFFCNRSKRDKMLDEWERGPWRG